MMSQDTLEDLPLERWSELQRIFKRDWPKHISGYVVLETQRDLKQRGYDYGFKVYCPFGDVNNGMVAINQKKQFYEIIIQCPTEACSNLEDALQKTNVIEWDKFTILAFAPYHVIEIVKKVACTKDVEMKLLPSETFLKTDKLFEGVPLPPGISFGPLTEENVNLVDSTWPHRYQNSTWYFEFLVKIGYGYGLFLENQLVAWLLFNESGNLLHLYTADGHRRKGYAALILKLVSNALLKEGKPVIAFCVKDNVNAYNLYKKLGFDKSEPRAWCYLSKKA